MELYRWEDDCSFINKKLSLAILEVRASHGFQSQQAIANDLYAINIAEPIHGFPYFLSFSFMIFHTLKDFSWNQMNKNESKNLSYV